MGLEQIYTDEDITLSPVSEFYVGTNKIPFFYKYNSDLSDVLRTGTYKSKYIEKYNIEVKKYPTGINRVRIFKNAKWKGLTQFRSKIRGDSLVSSSRVRSDSIKRKKDMIFDLSVCNDWKYFVTLTFNPEKIDRYDYVLCVKKLSLFLNNYRKVDKSFKYIFVPELHKDSAVHFHGLIYCSNKYMIDSSVKSNGKVIYNWYKWKWGFSTATLITDKLKVSYYITKYLTKSSDSSFNKRGFFHSRNLKLPEIFTFYAENFDTTFYQQIWHTDVSAGYESVNIPLDEDILYNFFEKKVDIK